MRRGLAVNLVTCLLLLIQYLLGMVDNVYVVLPRGIRARTLPTTSPDRLPASAG